MNKTYQAPKADIIVFAAQDIVTTSIFTGGNGNDGGFDLPIIPFVDGPVDEQQSM